MLNLWKTRNLARIAPTVGRIFFCQNLDYQTAIKAHIQKLYQVSVILILLDFRINRINHENLLIMLIMVQTTSSILETTY
jgi:hypothetical protein